MEGSYDMADMVVSLLTVEFDRVRVMDPVLRRRLVTRMLEEEDFVGEALGKYELDMLLSGGEDTNESMIEEQPRVIPLEMHLTAEEQTLLARNNRDVRILFEPGVVMPHAYYFAQRIIDTDRCLRVLAHYGGEIIDIGGNYAAHARQCRIVHSCTLLNSARESHRQTERQVRMMVENRGVDTLHYCTVGAQKCNHQATQSMSVHSMTDIPWEDWPEIMDRHGLSYHVGVFHYDPVMLTTPRGRLEGDFMYYEVSGDSVVFHFESDSSLDYTHNWTNFKKYTAPWCQFSKKTRYAYLYDIKSVQGGIATVEIVRTLQSDLGNQIERPMFAYVPMEDKVSISTWVYDLNSGLDTMDPGAYIPVDMMVDKEMYQFLFMYGVSNDSANPNKLLSLDEFRAMARTYNQTRRFGDACISGRRKISSLTAYGVYDGMYHVISRERALLASKADALTKAMIADQHMVDMSAAYVAAMLPLSAAGAVLVAPGKVFEYYFAKFTQAWKEYLASGIKRAVVTELPSYIPLPATGFSNVRGQHMDNRYAFQRPIGPPVEWDGIEPLALKLDESFSELASPATDDFDSFLGGVAATEDGSDTLVDLTSQGKGIRPLLLKRVLPNEDVTTEQLRDIFYDTSDSVTTDALLNSDYRVEQRDLLDEYQSLRSQLSTVKFSSAIQDDVQLLHRHARSSMIEFAVYCFDIGRGVLSTLKLHAAQVFPGSRPDSYRMENLNAGQDVGVKVLECFSGSVSVGGNGYAIGVDPTTSKVHVINKQGNGTFYIVDKSVRYLVVTESTRIFNTFAVAHGVLKSLKKEYKPSFKMSLINGVPGCGKTTEIVNSFTMSDMVLCAVRHSKDDTLARLLSKPGFEDDTDELKMRVRTLDSVVMHGFRGTGVVSTVHVDEGLLAFPGQMYAALEKVRPSRVVVYGDEHQIKAIDRSPSLGKLVHQGIGEWTSIERRDVSHSMPADVCVLLARQFYGRTIRTTSPVMRSLSMHTHKSVTDEAFVSAAKGYEYLSVLTADKSKLLTGLNFVDGKKLLEASVADGTGVVKVGGTKSRVFTVHEAQGQRLSRVNVVRMNPNTSAVLNSKEHVVVAISRHYYKCAYHTVGVDDMLAKMFREVVSDKDMRDVMLPASAESNKRIERLARGLDN